MGDISLRGQGRALLKKGGRAKDMSMKHEGMESILFYGLCNIKITNFPHPNRFIC